MKPSHGEALRTIFRSWTNGWSDPDGNIPLAYGFSYVSSEVPPVRIGGVGRATTANAPLPTGNLSASVSVSDRLGAASSARTGLAVMFNVQRRGIEEAVRNVTEQVAVVPGVGCKPPPRYGESSNEQGNFESMALVASSAELLNAVGENETISNVKQMRHSLLNLARNCSREWSGVHMDRVELQAATLEKITNKPEQVTAITNTVCTLSPQQKLTSIVSPFLHRSLRSHSCRRSTLRRRSRISRKGSGRSLRIPDSPSSKFYRKHWMRVSWMETVLIQLRPLPCSELLVSSIYFQRPTSLRGNTGS